MKNLFYILSFIFMLIQCGSRKSEDLSAMNAIRSQNLTQGSSSNAIALDSKTISLSWGNFNDAQKFEVFSDCQGVLTAKVVVQPEKGTQNFYIGKFDQKCLGKKPSLWIQSSLGVQPQDIQWGCNLETKNEYNIHCSGSGVKFGSNGEVVINVNTSDVGNLNEFKILASLD
jgi:hypothetical protein